MCADPVLIVGGGLGGPATLPALARDGLAAHLKLESRTLWESPIRPSSAAEALDLLPIVDSIAA